MVKIKKYRNRIEAFLSGDKGQRFFNFAYSIGAAIVIWGALFKILHLPGGNLLLAIGMGTEVLMFLLTAFDRPPRQYNWEEVFPVLDSHAEEERPVFHNSINTSNTNIKANVGTPHDETGTYHLNEDTGYIEKGNAISQHKPPQSTNIVSADFAPVADVSENYISEMGKVIQELTRLRETTTALNTLYELQLKSISAQLNTIEHSGRDISSMRDMMEKSALQSERYCKETEKMAQNMATLNAIYAGMISAMSNSRNNQ